MTTETTETRLSAAERAAVLAKHEAMCYWVAKRVGGANLSPDDLDDLAAVVRVQFVRASQTFDPSKGYQFATYALRAAMEQARQAARRIRARGIRVPVAYDPETPAPGIVDLNAHRPSDDGRDAIEFLPAREDEPGPELPADFWLHVAAALTEKQRRCVLMRYRDGMTYAEIGARIGRSKELVRQTLEAALEKLRKSPAMARCAADNEFLKAV